MTGRPYGHYCPVAKTLELVGGRWTLLIVRELLVGPQRFTDLHLALEGIPRNLLADRLRHLEAHGIVTQAWGPLGRDGRLLRDPVVVGLARRHAVAPAQIVLRWHLEHGLAFTARSSARERIAQNIALFDFALGPEDLELMRSLDAGRAPERDPERHGH